MSAENVHANFFAAKYWQSKFNCQFLTYRKPLSYKVKRALANIITIVVTFKNILTAKVVGEAN